MFAEGRFHTVKKALQRRQFIKTLQSDGDVPIIKEVKMDIPKPWVLKQVKNYSELHSVPKDIANQHIASILAKEFSKVLDSVF